MTLLLVKEVFGKTLFCLSDHLRDVEKERFDNPRKKPRALLWLRTLAGQDLYED